MKKTFLAAVAAGMLLATGASTVLAADPPPTVPAYQGSLNCQYGASLGAGNNRTAGQQHCPIYAEAPIQPLSNTATTGHPLSNTAATIQPLSNP